MNSRLGRRIKRERVFRAFFLLNWLLPFKRKTWKLVLCSLDDRQTPFEIQLMEPQDAIRHLLYFFAVSYQMDRISYFLVLQSKPCWWFPYVFLCFRRRIKRRSSSKYLKYRRRNRRIKREGNRKVKLPNVELNEGRIKREGSVLAGTKTRTLKWFYSTY